MKISFNVVGAEDCCYNRFRLECISEDFNLEVRFVLIHVFFCHCQRRHILVVSFSVRACVPAHPLASRVFIFIIE